MKKFICYLLLLSLIACNKDESTKKSESQVMDLENLAVGQKFQFILFTAESYFDEDNNAFQYTGDTLEVEVIEKNNDTYSLSERFTEGSAIHTNSENYYWGDPALEYVNAWTIENGVLKVQDNNNDFFLDSHLMFAQELPLFEFNEKEVEVNGWKTTHNYTELNAELFIKDFDLKGISYDRLNVAINNAAMAGDGPGNTTFYSNKHGIVRTSKYSAWTGAGFGWDKI